jgi:hypothetical protein
MLDMHKKGAMSANEMYRNSGSTLPFKDWLDLAKSQGSVIPNKPALDIYMNMDGAAAGTANATEDQSGQMHTNIFRSVLLLAAAIAIYKVWRKKS